MENAAIAVKCLAEDCTGGGEAPAPLFNLFGSTQNEAKCTEQDKSVI